MTTFSPQWITRLWDEWCKMARLKSKLMMLPFRSRSSSRLKWQLQIEWETKSARTGSSLVKCDRSLHILLLGKTVIRCSPQLSQLNKRRIHQVATHKEVYRMETIQARNKRCNKRRRSKNLFSSRLYTTMTAKRSIWATQSVHLATRWRG